MNATAQMNLRRPWVALAWACALVFGYAGVAAEEAGATESKPPLTKKARTGKPAAETSEAAAATEASKGAASEPAKSAKSATAATAATAEAAAASATAATAATSGEPGKESKQERRQSAESPTVRESTSATRRRRAKEERAIEDPMDKLRALLADRLGAAKSGDGQALRVIAHSPAPSAATQGLQAGAAQAAAKKLAGKVQPGPSPHWGYQGEAGPQSWGRLKPEFVKCASGERQSPIDIRDGLKLQLDPVQFDYRPSSFRVIDNGHTVQVNVAAGNSIEAIGRRYGLVQFHFHRPSEERIDGREFDMVAHLVHKDHEGRLAVVAVLLEQGSAHPLVQSVWNNLPLEKGEEVRAKAILDLNALLPTERNYFTYMGSLTTPPCSEGVLWMVMKQPVQISTEQIAIFARLYPMNARPIQSASGRLIKESN
jgi:carbonic anhydrase